MGFDFTGFGSVADLAKTIVDRVAPQKMSEADRAQTQIGLQQLLTERDNTVDQSRRDVIVAELNQGDNYTKRARPTIVYVGLVFIGLVHVVFPMAAAFGSLAPGAEGIVLPAISLPTEFWWTWGGVTGAYSIGRSAEKRGVKNKLVGMITGAGGI